MIYCGDALEVLKTLPSETIDCCVTSPPYYGLRDYGTGRWVGGDPNCDHEEARLSTRFERTMTQASQKQKSNMGSDVQAFMKICPKCGAVREDFQIGLEDSPAEYIKRLVDLFREVRRVLKADGTLWVNIGDSYAAQRGGTHQPAETLSGGVHGYQDGARVNRGRGDTYNPTRNASAIGLKHKDLIGIPWMLAFALRKDGWYLRQDIIWHKPNPMPESVRDRCTKSHEYIFLLSKSPKYYFDYMAIQEDAIGQTNQPRIFGAKTQLGTNRNDVGNLYDGGDGKRNKRDVWTVTTKPFRGAHFATFPEELIEPCILAGSRKDGIVLDPFFGSGTTGVVSMRYGRRYIGIELNPKYVEIAKKRTSSVQMSFIGDIYNGFDEDEQDVLTNIYAKEA